MSTQDEILKVSESRYHINDIIRAETFETRGICSLVQETVNCEATVSEKVEITSKRSTFPNSLVKNYYLSLLKRENKKELFNLD